MVELSAPSELSGLGIPENLVADVFIQRLRSARTATLVELAVALGISVGIATEIAEDLRHKQIVEFLGMEGRDYRVGLTGAGTEAAITAAHNCTYADVLPVSLSFYVALVEQQKAEPTLDRATIRDAFADLVVSDQILDQLGPAFLNDGAIFLYGPPGTGKTSLAERMIRMHNDGVYIPRSVTVDGTIITVFDPTIHSPLPDQPAGLDPRLVACSRPTVVVGGELNMAMLDLDLDAGSGIYQAPIQMMANNGILVVDDFGRQQINPSELLNRWIVPLSRGIDYLKLGSGTKFQVPFEVKLVASTNLDPNSLGDDAFLRRLRNKVYVGPLDPESFDRILEGVAHSRDIALSPDSTGYLRRVAIHHIGELRPYLAVDFCDLMVGICAYEGWPRALDVAMIARVAEVYFVTEGQDPVPPRANKAEPPASVPGANAAIPAPAPPVPNPSMVPDPSDAAFDPANGNADDRTQDAGGFDPESGDADGELSNSSSDDNTPREPFAMGPGSPSPASPSPGSPTPVNSDLVSSDPVSSDPVSSDPARSMPVVSAPPPPPPMNASDDDMLVRNGVTNADENPAATETPMSDPSESNDVHESAAAAFEPTEVTDAPEAPAPPPPPPPGAAFDTDSHSELDSSEPSGAPAGSNVWSATTL